VLLGGVLVVLVKWHGHACFEVRGEVTVVVDPHDGSSLGLKPPQAQADVVLVTHKHFDHVNGLKYVKKRDAVVVDKPGQYEVKGVKIVGVKTYHDDAMGSKRGVNIAYTFELGGLRFCHLGDLGHVLSESQAEALKPVNVLMIPVGGTFTIDAKQADIVVQMLNPNIVIPMHYKVPGLDLPISGVEPFIEDKSNVEVVSSASYEVSVESLPRDLRILVLSPP